MKSSFITANVMHFVCFIACLCFSNKALAQQNILERPVSLSIEDTPLSNVLEKITDLTNAQFVFDKRVIPLGQKVVLKIDNQPLRQVLDKLLEGTNIEFSAFENQISFFRKKSPKFTISGYVRDRSSGEALIGTNIYEVNSLKGTTSNEYGFFSLTLEEGMQEIVWSFIGYQERQDSIPLFANILKTVYLNQGNELKEIVVVPVDSVYQNEALPPSLDFGENLTSEISSAQVEEMPALLGENDVMRSFTLRPGIQSGNEGSNGISVRGGGPDQNLVLLDGVPIYNAYHLFGFVSVFNSNAVNRAKIYKSGFPARYSGRLSSIMDIRMRDGNMKRFHGGLNLGLLSGSIFFEGPIVKNKGSFLITGRRTWLDILARTLINANSFVRGGYGFYDVNIKLNYKINHKNRVFASLFTGSDTYFREALGATNGSVQDNNRQAWGNAIVALRWNSILTPKLFSNTTITFSDFFNKIENNHVFYSNLSESTRYDFSSNSKITQLGLKMDFDYSPVSNQLIRFGFGYSRHKYLPSEVINSIAFQGTETLTSSSSPIVYSNDIYVYAESKIAISNKFSIHPGLHLSGYFNEEIVYLQPQPRLLINYDFNSNNHISASYSRMGQSVHLLTDPGIGFPSDIWVPSTKKIAPEYADQVSLAYIRNMKKDFQLRFEVFHKESNNIIEYEEGASFFNSSTNWENKVESGNGRSFGAEFLLERTKGRTRGWVSYTASKTTRKFEELNSGKRFPYRFDRNHDVSIVLNHKFGPKIDMGAVWVYATGNAVSLSLQRYQSLDATTGFLTNITNVPEDIFYFEERNNYRMPATHRLDFCFNFHKEKRLIDRTWTVGIYNLYGRQNPYTVYAKKEGNEINIYQTSILGAPFPYFMYRIKF